MNSHSGCQRKLTHTLHSFPRSTTAFLASLSLIPEKKNCLMAGHAVAFVSPSDAAWIKCSRPLPANDSVMGASLNVLSMLCGNNIVARGAAPTLCKSALPGYTSAQVLKTPSERIVAPTACGYFYVHWFCVTSQWAGERLIQYRLAGNMPADFDGFHLLPTPCSKQGF